MKWNSTTNFSFEFYPPKTAVGEKKLKATAEKLSTLNPEFFSVTSGAGGTVKCGTDKTINQIKTCNVAMAPHITCKDITKNDIKIALENYKANNIKRLVVLRGDLANSSEFNNASDLLAFIKDNSHDTFHLEVAAYPEAHPESQNLKDELINFKKKVDAGANSAITQYFFNPDAYYNFLDQCEKHHITIPITPGIMPIINFNKLQEFSKNCGAEIPRWIIKKLEAYGKDDDAIKNAGMEIVFNLCEKLLKQGAPGLHFYTLNNAEPSFTIAKLMGAKVENLALV